MRKIEMKNLVQSVTIKTPCSVGWENMEGDEKVRFCGKCKLNVHNLSNMSEKEAASVIANKNDKLCVFIARRQDGTVITDNCPVKLQVIRNRIRAYAASALISLTWSWALGASAQGIDAAQLDPRYGEGGHIAQLADYGYDTVRDISRLVTALSFVIALFVPMDKKKEGNLRLIALELIALACIPILVHLAGTFLNCNYSNTIGGGL